MSLLDDIFKLPYFDAKDPDGAERTFKTLSIGAKFLDRPHTNKMIDHYMETSPLFSKGTPYDYPVSDLRKTKTIRDAESTNQNRLLNSLYEPGRLRKKKNPFSIDNIDSDTPYSFSDIKDGEKFSLVDYYDYATKYAEMDKNKDRDLSTSYGRGKLHSKSNLDFVKFDNIILPYGHVAHEMEEDYKFNEGDRFGKAGQTLYKANRARPYHVKSSWKTYPMGVIRTDKGNLDYSGIK